MDVYQNEPHCDGLGIITLFSYSTSTKSGSEVLLSEQNTLRYTLIALAHTTWHLVTAIVP